MSCWGHGLLICDIYLFAAKYTSGLHRLWSFLGNIPTLVWWCFFFFFIKMFHLDMLLANSTFPGEMLLLIWNGGKRNFSSDQPRLLSAIWLTVYLYAVPVCCVQLPLTNSNWMFLTLAWPYMSNRYYRFRQSLVGSGLSNYSPRDLCSCSGVLWLPHSSYSGRGCLVGGKIWVWVP